MKQQLAPPRLRRLAVEKQRKLDALLEKNREGTITPTERRVLERLVATAERLMVENAKQLAVFARQSRSKKPTHAVPVTVWVSPANSER